MAKIQCSHQSSVEDIDASADSATDMGLSTVSVSLAPQYVTSDDDEYTDTLSCQLAAVADCQSLGLEHVSQQDAAAMHSVFEYLKERFALVKLSSACCRF